ncbi:thioredoxin domain-containing protein [Nitrosospira sp. Nsp1]|uniref:DsbA family protein n=1 Tax=Nitrosospira sp. Nsp1 TaxID=136547 RepID=UPI0008922DDD|nr:thioredoxin domain-containing protein [Nitrosospira sp. Nsp1]SCX56373.1 Thioredoxin [Nitrosospira sp. Nsp1]
MSQGKSSGLLDKAVDESRDHILGSSSADITLVEYGSYACPHCRAANEKIAQVRDQLGDRLRYVFRHYPLIGNPLASAPPSWSSVRLTQRVSGTPTSL